MLYENKLTNLVFKNQENSAKHNLLPFKKKKNYLLLFEKDKQEQLRMKLNVIQCKS